MKKTFFGYRQLILPTYPYDRAYHNWNTKHEEQSLPDFKKIFVCPTFRTKGRLEHVLDTFLIAQKAYRDHNMVEPLLYCKPIWPFNGFDEGDCYESNYPLNNPKRVLWNCCGVWEVCFVLKKLPKEWQYASGSFENKFESALSAERALEEYIINHSRSA